MKRINIRCWIGFAAALVAALGIFASATSSTHAKQAKKPVVISAAGASGCLAIHRASRSQGKSAVIGDCHGKVSQQWVRTSSKQFQVKHSGLCLNILNADKKRGAAVVQESCEKAKSQQWYVTSKGEIRSKLNHMCLTISHGGSRIVMNGCSGAANQLCKLGGL
jgi:hypothetical protein